MKDVDVRLIDQTTPADFTSSPPGESIDRVAFADAIQGTQSTFIKLASGCKHPAQRFKGKAGLKTPPKEENYGVRPASGLLVVDIDTKAGTPVSLQVEFMEQVLGIDFMGSLKVTTPSGGLHIYLTLPDSFSADDFPNGNMRHYEAALREAFPEADHILGKYDLDVDFRSGAAGRAIYVVGVGSTTPDGTYSFIPGEIKNVPEENAVEIISLRDKQRASRKSSGAARPSVSSNPSKWFGSYDAPHSLVGPSLSKERLAALVERLRLFVGNKKVSFHAQRAFVFANLQCCFTDYKIADVCADLGIDRDTYTDSRVAEATLMIDLERLRSSASDSFHGPACGKGAFAAKFHTDSTLDEGLEKLRVRVKDRKLARSSRSTRTPERTIVVSLPRVEEALREVTSDKTKQFANSVRVIADVVQPILNSGADRVVMSREFLEEELELSKSQVAQALVVLRKAKVLELRDRQRTGVAPTYRVSRAMLDDELQKLVVMERYSRYIADDVWATVLVDSYTGGMVEAFTGEVIVSGGQFSDTAYAVAQKYGKKEAELREELAAGRVSDDWGVDQLIADVLGPKYLLPSPGLPEVSESEELRLDASVFSAQARSSSHVREGLSEEPEPLGCDPPQFAGSG